MRFHNIIDHILGQRSKVRILRFFAIQNKEASIREISREIKIAPPSTARSLSSLKNEGLLTVKRIGRSHVYALNKENIFVKDALLPFFVYEKAMIVRLADIIRPLIKTPYKSIILFGSVARREEKTRSDIDLAIIIDKKADKAAIEDEVLAASSAVSLKFGNSLSPVFFTIAKFKRQYRNNKPLVNTIYKEGRVIAGKNLNELISE